MYQIISNYEDLTGFSYKFKIYLIEDDFWKYLEYFINDLRLI